MGYKGPLGGPFVSHVIAFGCLSRLAGAKAAIVLALGGRKDTFPAAVNRPLRVELLA